MKKSFCTGLLLAAMTQAATAEVMTLSCMQDGLQEPDTMRIDLERGTVKWFTRASYSINTLDDDFLFAVQAVPGRPWVNALMLERETGRFWHSSLSAVFCSNDDCTRREGEAAIATGLCRDPGS